MSSVLLSHNHLGGPLICTRDPRISWSWSQHRTKIWIFRVIKVIMVNQVNMLPACGGIWCLGSLMYICDSNISLLVRFIFKKICILQLLHTLLLFQLHHLLPALFVHGIFGEPLLRPPHVEGLPKAYPWLCWQILIMAPIIESL